MLITQEQIERQSAEWNERKRINRLMICRASYSSGVPNGVEFAECQDESLKPCDLCPVKKAWETVRKAYLEQGLSPSEASWLTHQFYDIPTAYLCNGQMREAEKKFFPKRYEEAIRRQNELLGEGKDIVRTNEQKEQKSKYSQMSIFDYQEGVTNEQ